MLGTNSLSPGGKMRTVSACRPWQSVDAIAVVNARMSKTPQRLIDKCLSCKEAYCKDCLAARERSR